MISSSRGPQNQRTGVADEVGARLCEDGPGARFAQGDVGGRRDGVGAWHAGGGDVEGGGRRVREAASREVGWR
jgi:hypothetical protein